MGPKFIATLVDHHAHRHAYMTNPVLSKVYNVSYYVSISYNAYKQKGTVRIKTSIAYINLIATSLPGVHSWCEFL